MENQPLLFSSFGEQLITYRKRAGLTQKQLAQLLGVHANTVSAWELGTYLPHARGLVLELARHLHLDELETRHLLEASLTALPPHWLVPLPRNPFFTGREEVLETLHGQLGTNQMVALTQSSALSGLGGVGKTQIALEYAYRYALEYSAVFWIGAETAESIISSMARIAQVLQVLGRDDKDQQRVIAAVQHWFSTHTHWLLIWDNVEELALLDRFLPSSRSGAILITTRSQSLGTLARGLNLSPMEQEEGVLFLLRRAKMLEPGATREQVSQLAINKPDVYTAAEELVTVLGGLPLALDQAGAYIEETGCSLADYLHRYGQQRIRLLERRGAFASHHPQSVATTLWLTIRRVAEHHPAALEVLRLCALVSPDAIPEELFVNGAAHLGPVLGPVASDAAQFDQAIAALHSFSLVQRHPETRTLTLHRLVQVVLRARMNEQEHKQWIRRVIEAIDAVFPEVQQTMEYAAWRHCERLLPHAFSCLNQIEATEESLTFASLAYKVAQYLLMRGWYTEAEPLYVRALHLREQELGPVHPDVATSLNGLAALYREQGKYAEAEPLYQRALHMRERVLGLEHLDVARTLNSLAILFWEQGKYVEAETLYQRSLFICEQFLDADHPEVARLLNNLAILYTDQEKYREAERFSQRALYIWKQALGSDHPLVGTSLYNLANLYQIQGKDTEAEPLAMRALHIRELKLGRDHQLVAYPLNTLAHIYCHQGKYAEAESLYQRALHIRELKLGRDHPDVSYSLIGLANLYREQARYAEAEPLYERALSIRERHLGPQHPETAQTLYDLAVFQQRQGNLSEALSLAERTLSIRSQSLGDAHPKTIAARALSVQLLKEQASALEKTTAKRGDGEMPDPRAKGGQAEKVPGPLYADGDSSFSENDPLQRFLDACCEFHPRAWCRSADLWQAYECWVQQRQERFPLSRRAFSTQLKARGCRADHTRTARIWRGITLINRDA